MHVNQFVRGKGLFIETDYVPTEDRSNRKFPILLTTGRTLEYSDWATNCPEYKVTAVQIAPATHRSKWQSEFSKKSREQGRIL